MSKKSIKDYFDVAQLESVDRLGKPPSKEQQLSRTQHFTLKAHAAIFVLHIQYGPRGTPLTPMIQRQNFFLSTKVMNQSINQSINQFYLKSLRGIKVALSIQAGGSCMKRTTKIKLKSEMRLKK